MNGLERITEKILADAREQAAVIAAQAATDAKSIAERGEEEAQALLRTMEDAADKEADAIRARALSTASLTGRRIRLDARQKSVSDLVDRALSSLPGLSDEEKTELYAGYLSIAKGGETVVFCARDLASGVAAAAIQAAGKNRIDQGLPVAELTLCDTPGSFSGGLILQRGRIEDNLTFELLAQQSREDLETYAARLLEK